MTPGDTKWMFPKFSDTLQSEANLSTAEKGWLIYVPMVWISFLAKGKNIRAIGNSHTQPIADYVNLDWGEK